MVNTLTGKLRSPETAGAATRQQREAVVILLNRFMTCCVCFEYVSSLALLGTYPISDIGQSVLGNCGALCTMSGGIVRSCFRAYASNRTHSPS